MELPISEGEDNGETNFGVGSVVQFHSTNLK